MTHRAFRAGAAGATAAALALLCACGSGDAPSTLAQRGYAIDAKGVCKAIGQGDVEALRLLDQAGAKATTLVIDGERFCLEAALAGKAPKVDLAALFAQVKAPRDEINRVYASATGMTARDVPQAEALARAAGQRAVNLYAGGKVVEATPLMWAIWSDDSAAAEQLLRQGADPNLAARVPVHVGTAGAPSLTREEAVNISTTPLFEAHRLQRTAIVRLLERAGAKASITSAKPNV